jgi:hypothetical protein
MALHVSEISKTANSINVAIHSTVETRCLPCTAETCSFYV